MAPELAVPFPAIEDALKKTASALKEADIPFLLGGSLACWVRGGPQSTHDLDIMLRPEDADRALEALGEAGMRTERAAEDWLVKAWDGDVLIDLIFGPTGLSIDDELIASGEERYAAGMMMRVMRLEDVLATKLLSLNEHYLDYESGLQIARAVREQVDWEELRERTGHSPYARAFFFLVEDLGVLPAAVERGAGAG
jgi:hypothetical protein